MYIPVVSALLRIRIYSDKLSKYLNYYIVISSLYFLIKSVQVIYVLNGLSLSILAAIAFPITILFYPLSLIFTSDYSAFFNHQILFYFVPIIFRLIVRNSKRRYQMIKHVVIFLLLSTTAFADGLYFLRSEEPLSFEKFIFKYSLKVPIVKNLERIRDVNKKICGDAFSVTLKEEQKCKFLFVSPDKIKIFKNDHSSEKIIIYYPDKDIIEY